MNVSKTGIFALLLTSSLTIMVGTAIAPSLGEISIHLGLSAWLVTLPSLGVVLFAPLMGWLIDRKGPYVVLCGGFIPYALLGAGGAWLHHPYLIIADRILLGGATAALAASGTGLIALLFDGQKRMQVIAWQGMAIEMGGVVFLSIGGILGEWNWHYPFFIYLLALICLVLTLTAIPSPPKAAVEKDHSPVSKNIAFIVLFATCSMILFFVAFTKLPLYLPAAFGFSESQTGYFMAFISLIAVLAASQMPKIVARIKAWNTVALGFLFFMSALALFQWAGSVLLLIIAAVLMGIGFGCTVPLLNHMTVEESTSHNRGRNLGYYSMGIFGGQFLSSFISTGFLAGALLSFLAAIVIFLRKS